MEITIHEHAWTYTVRLKKCGRLMMSAPMQRKDAETYAKRRGGSVVKTCADCGHFEAHMSAQTGRWW